MNYLRIHTELGWAIIGQGATLIGGFFTLKVLTTLLGTQDYGRFVLGLTVAGILNLFLYGPLAQGVTRYFHIFAERAVLGTFSCLVVSLQKIFAIILIFLSVAIALWVSWKAGVDWALLILAATGYGVAAGTLSIAMAVLGTQRKQKAYATLQTVDMLLRLILSILLVCAAGHNGVMAMAGFFLGSCLTMLLARKFENDWTYDTQHQEITVAQLFAQGSFGREFGRYTFSFTLFAIPAAFSSFGDRWIIQGILSDGHVGAYVALAQIANAPTNIILAIFSQVVNPILFQRAGSASSPDTLAVGRRLLYRALMLLVLGITAAVGASYVFAPQIVALLTAPDFVRYSDLLWLLVLGAGIFQVAQALASEAFMFNRPSLLFFPKLVHAVIFFGLSLLFSMHWGLSGIAVAGVVAAISYLLLVALFNAKATAKI